MKKWLSILFVAVMALSFSATTASASVTKGQKLFIKKYKKACGFDGGAMAKKHTQEEWASIFKSGKLSDEILAICPKAKKTKKKYAKHLYDFFYNYASDSGNIPS